MCPKWFMSLWYIRRKPCTYIASRLVLSPNGPKRASSWASSPRSTIGCIQNNFWAYGMFAQTVHQFCIDTNTVSKQFKTRLHMTHITEEFHRVRPKWFLILWYVRCKPCSYLASELPLSPNGPKSASTWASSPRSTIGCVQNYLWAYGTFGATMHLCWR
jgi:hypothetical protein